MREKILGFIAFLMIRFLGMTFRYRLSFAHEEDKEYFYRCFPKSDEKRNANYLLAFLHQDELNYLNFFRGGNTHVMVSLSKDGEIMTNAIKYLGYGTVRGSSSRKAVSALIAALKKVQAGTPMAFAVDGPRGPRYKVKGGICQISQKTQVPIIPLGSIVSRKKVFEKSWSKSIFALPFARVEIIIGKIKVYTPEELERELITIGKKTLE